MKPTIPSGLKGIGIINSLKLFKVGLIFSELSRRKNWRLMNFIPGCCKATVIRRMESMEEFRSLRIVDYSYKS